MDLLVIVGGWRAPAPPVTPLAPAVRAGERVALTISERTTRVQLIR
ncbi:MAG: hypothetical protein HYU51_03465 [Candidatus Rokubacteria bacterium]|nr:hypothetical protein [Candidatus Rokubacteria bacterium]